VLLAVYGAEGLGEERREAAAVSMFQLSEPTTELLEHVAGRSENLRSMGPADATNLLLFGTLSSRGELAEGESAVARLLGLEERSRELDASRVWLEALGNAATPEVAAEAERYLEDADPLVRESAVAALDRSGADNVVPRFVAAAEGDANRNVRLRAIEALGTRDDEIGRGALRRLAEDDPDESIRGAALYGLAARRPLAAADQKALELAERNDPSEDLRATARRLLER
jgi:HEAT repeat protein